METKNLKITDAEDWFENNKRTFNGVNAGEFLDKADFLSFANELQSEYEHLKQLLQEITENAVFNAGTDYRIDEKFIEKAKSFLNTKHSSYERRIG